MALGISVAALVISVIALSIPFFVERLKRPELEIGPQKEEPKESSKNWYYHMDVWNKKRRFIGALIQRHIAQHCKARIEFLDKKSRKPIINQITAKWAQQPNPIDIQIVEGRLQQIFDQTKLPMCQTIDIGFERRTFDGAIKFRGEKECYAFDPWLHFINPKKIELKLNVEECIVKVEISATNLPHPKIAQFLLLNKGTELKDLRIKLV